MRDSPHHQLHRLPCPLIAAAFLAVPGCGGALPRTDPHVAAATSRIAVYIGTYTDAGSRGIYRFELDTASGVVTAPELAGEARNPSFLAIHPNGRSLYAVNEVGDFGGAPTGAVSAFAVEPVSGALTLLNQQPSAGAAPCHLVLDKDGRNLLVANYTGGTVAVLPLAPDGTLNPPVSVHRHEGSGPNKPRQASPHAHAILLDAAGQFAFEANLGTDRVYAYRFNAAAAALEPHQPEETALKPGSGPRHLAWHPSGRYLYCINELDSTVAVFRYDVLHGTLAGIQTVTTLGPGFSGRNTAAEIAVSRDGRFLYGSNRGDDSLAIFAIDASSGTMRPAGHVSTGGRTPRHFAIDESGRWLLVANQDSDSITIFHRDPLTGLPSLSGRLTVPKPVCVLFAPATR